MLLERVKNLKIEEVLRTLLNIEPVGEERGGEILVYRCCLPSHRDRTPSLKVFTQTNSFFCFGCRRGGDVINLVSYIRKCTNKEAISFLAELFNIPRVGELTLQDYSTQKQIPVDFLASLGISDGLKIPYYGLQREEINTRLRLDNKKFRWVNNKIVAYGAWQEWNGFPYAFIVEGESDCHTLWYNNFPAYGVPGVSLVSKALESIYDQHLSLRETL